MDTLNRVTPQRMLHALTPAGDEPAFLDQLRRHVTGPKLVLGDFNEWMRGMTTKLLSSKLKSVDLTLYLKRRRTYPGLRHELHNEPEGPQIIDEIIGWLRERATVTA